MSILIDNLLKEDHSEECFDDGWFIAKPLGKSNIIQKLKDIVRIILNKGFVVHYKKDEVT